MLIVIGLVAGAAYVASTYVTYSALSGQRFCRNGVIYGITGMIVSGVVLGSALERLLP